MSVVYSAATKTARMNGVVTTIGASGFIKFYTSNGGTLLATFALAATAGTVSGNVLTFSDANGATAGIMNTTAAAPGTATYARITTAADADVVTGLTVGTSGTDFVVDNNVFTAGQAVTMNSATLTHA
jgi:hypothetical protein